MAGDQPEWRKSSYSGPQSNCIEVAPLQDATGIRDSKNPDGGELRIPRTAWYAFVRTTDRLGA